MKRLTAFACAALLLLSGCAANTPQQKRFTATFLNLFDTVTTIVGYADSEAAFTDVSQSIHDELENYHQLFDIYNDYEGLNNLKTVNDRAGIAPVKVDRPILELLKDCKTYYTLSGGKINVAFGSVLRLWHEARQAGIQDPENARLPDEKALQEAALHTDIHAIVIDEAASTVYLSDPLIRLDVGAVAKGWAAQRVCENAPDGLLVSVGGNVLATGPKPEDAPWVVGIQDPDDSSRYLHTLNIRTESVVTSGDYQRAYAVSGKLYHHIIDPATLYPGNLWRAVSIVCDDSGLADALSTALFLLPLAEGQALLDQCGAEAMWVDHTGAITYSPGFKDLIKR